MRRRIEEVDEDPGAHLVLGSFLARSGDVDGTKVHWRRAIDVAASRSERPSSRIIRAWATRELHGVSAARALEGF